MNRILLSSVLTLLIGVPLCHFIWGEWARHQLNQTLADLHARGEPITPAELHLDSIPDAQNASLDYKAAGDSIDRSSAAWKPYDESTGKDFQPPLTDAELQTTHAILAENKAGLDQVIAARSKSIDGWQDGFNHPSLIANYHLNGARSLGELLKLAAYTAQTEHDDTLALQRLDDVLRIADASEHRPTLIGHLVAVGMTAIASDMTAKLAVNLHVPPDGPLHQQVINLLHEMADESELNAGAQRSWRSERLAFLSTINDMAIGNMSFGTVTGGPTAGSRVSGYLMKPIFFNDAKLYALYLQGVMQAGQAPDWPAAQAQLPTALHQSIDAHPLYHVLLRILLPSIDKAVILDYRARAERRLAVVALAARLYAADNHDRLPAALSDLVPVYLPAIPIDPLSGKPLLFKSDPPRVYSIGEDGVDDGGVPIDLDGDTYHRHHGDILVYLTPQPRVVAPPTTEPQ